ncbi:MAG TPA: Lrp/AsnC family transcriptional regulator [Vicinamibacterales bacterium]|nr:Lrp/AsnC family transcriptional regulator [Vicinamibacterales bacterium]
MIDDTDATILELLQENARISQAEVARAVGLAPSAVLERIRKLESRGVIKGYTALLDPHALEQSMLAFIAVRSEHAPGDDSVSKALAQCPEVLELHHVAGDDCYLVKVRARDAEHIGRLLRHRFGRIPGVRSTRTTIVLETVKETPRLALRIAPEPVR